MVQIHYSLLIPEKLSQLSKFVDEEWLCNRYAETKILLCICCNTNVSVIDIKYLFLKTTEFVTICRTVQENKLILTFF